VRALAAELRGDAGAERHRALGAQAQPVEVEPGRLHRQRLLHAGRERGVVAAAVRRAQQREHERVAVAAAEGQRAAVRVLPQARAA